MGNLFEQSGAKLCVQFGEIIGFKNIVEKWMDNLAKIFRWNNLVEKLSWTSLQCTLYSVH